jgi:restriction endonuclease Mrr
MFNLGRLLPRAFGNRGTEKAPRAEQAIGDLHQLSPQQFKIACIELLTVLGFEIDTAENAESGGVDIVALKNEMTYFIQCRRPGARQVGLEAVRAFHAAMERADWPRGLFVSTASFSPRAEEFVAGKPIGLIDGAQLINYLKHLGTDPNALLAAKPEPSLPLAPDQAE